MREQPSTLGSFLIRLLLTARDTLERGDHFTTQNLRQGWSLNIVEGKFILVCLNPEAMDEFITTVRAIEGFSIRVISREQIIIMPAQLPLARALSALCRYGRGPHSLYTF